jgi:hypothetical protein
MDEKTRRRLATLAEELQRLPPDAYLDLYARFTRHAFSAYLPAHHSTRSLFGSSCAKTYLLVLTGRDATDGTGKVTIRIDPLLCGATTEEVAPETLVMIRHPNFVATPLAATPAFATVQTAATSQSLSPGAILYDRSGNSLDLPQLVDVTVDVHTWKDDGSAAPSTSFSWICTIEAARIVFIGG